MKALLLDTSTEKSFISVYDGKKIVYRYVLPKALNQSKDLFLKINEALKEGVDDLAFIAVGVGPGSYTGIRVCASVAKMLSFAKQIPLIGISSLKAFLPTKNGPFAVLIDAKISGAYLIKGNRQENDVCYLSEPMVCSLNNLQEELKGVAHIVTPNASFLEKKVSNPSFEWEEKDPAFLHFAKLAHLAFEKKQYTLDGSLDLLYLRKTQAEIDKGL